MQNTLLPVLLFAGLVVLVYAANRVAFWCKEGRKLQISGYVPPPPTLFARLFGKFVCRLFAFAGVGPVKVTGRENCRYSGSLLVAPNHQFELDFSVVGTAVPFMFRQLASAHEVQGIRAPIAAWTGNFAVQVDKGKSNKGSTAVAAVRACANVLKQPGARLLMFPQGFLDRENALKPEEFRTGADRSLQLAAEESDPSALAVLPVGIHYVKEPRGHRFARHLFGGTRYGANVAVGKPIPFSALSSDPREATEQIRLAIAALVEVAKTL